MAGNANRISSDVTRIVQVNIGMRNIDMPGARRVKIVATKFTAPMIEAMPVSASPTIHRSVPVELLNVGSLSGA